MLPPSLLIPPRSGVSSPLDNWAPQASFRYPGKSRATFQGRIRVYNRAWSLKEEKEQRRVVCVCVCVCLSHLPLTHKVLWQYRVSAPWISLSSPFSHSSPFLSFNRFHKRQPTEDCNCFYSRNGENERERDEFKTLRVFVWLVISPFFPSLYPGVSPCLRDRAGHVCMLSGWICRWGNYWSPRILSNM